ncbi:MAG: sulfite exporter TauE/SafE family protein [Clostridia bacterium]|nr:sulfite exporter TauE/SafE family protein [Clostridia bacterium]
MLETVFLGGMSMASSLLQSVTGFGFAIIMMAIMPLFLPYQSALGISTILSATLNAVILRRCWRDIDLKQLWLPVLFCLCGSSFGTFLMASNPSPIYKRALGVFLIFLAIWLYFFSDRVRIKPTTLSAGIAGIISGMCGGLFSVNGPPMVLYFISVIENKRTYMATIQCYFLINNIYLLIVRTMLDLMPGGILVSSLWGLGGLVLGSFLGGKIFDKLDGDKLKGFVYIFMALSGAWIAING